MEIFFMLTSTFLFCFIIALLLNNNNNKREAIKERFIKYYSLNISKYEYGSFLDALFDFYNETGEKEIFSIYENKIGKEIDLQLIK